MNEPGRNSLQGEGDFAARIDRVEAEFAGSPEVGKIVAFLRIKGRRPVMLTKVRGRRTDDPE